MSKTYAVATVIKTLEGSTLNEHLTLKIVRGQESRGDAFLKVFYEEKRTMYPGGGCYLASVLEVCPDDNSSSSDKLQAAEAKAERYEKALKIIEQMSDPGDYWKAIYDMKSIAGNALTPKTSTDE